MEKNEFLESNEFLEPSKTDFTIYSKSGCHFCTKAKTLLKEKGIKFIMIDCDEYIIENKPLFLSFIKKLAHKEYTSFPMIFYNGDFIGGYKETEEIIKKQFLSFDEI